MPKYKPGLHQYCYYKQLHNNFCSLSHACGALERGNIIWRLAMVMDLHNRFLPMAGMSKTQSPWIKCGVMILARLKWILCAGFTKCSLVSALYFNQHLGNKNQVASLSWWPKEGVFINSGLWPGYWSHGCEDWFQTQYKHIVEQHPKHSTPKISNNWQNYLKMDKRVKQLRIANTAVAAQYLGRSDST